MLHLECLTVICSSVIRSFEFFSIIDLAFHTTAALCVSLMNFGGLFGNFFSGYISDSFITQVDTCTSVTVHCACMHYVRTASWRDLSMLLAKNAYSCMF